MTSRVPFSLRRVLIGYVITLLAAACGSPFLIIGLIRADRCTAGLGCLGDAFFGYAGAGLTAVLVLLALAVIFRAGVLFWLVVLAVAIVPNLISNFQQLPILALLAAPTVAAWVTHPPRRPGPLSSSATRRVLSRSGVLAVVLLLVPASLNLLT